MDDISLTGTISVASAETGNARSNAGKVFTVCRIDDVDAFRSLRPEWNELLSQSGADCMFLTWEWLFTWWNHLSAGRTLQIIAVRCNGQLVGIAPLAVRRAQLKRLIPFKVVEFLGTGTVGSDYLDVIIKRGLEQPVLDALRNYLARYNRVLEFSQLRAAFSQAGELAGRLVQSGWRSRGTSVNVCSYINLSTVQCWDAYLAQLGSRHRRNVRQRGRALASGFTINAEHATDERSRVHHLQNFLDLHNRRWGERGGSDAFDGAGLREFHSEFSRIALEQGWLRLRLLNLDGKPAAAVYAFRYGDVFYYYQAGFDPVYAHHSIGLYSLGLAIRDAIEEGVREFDLLHGDETYKSLWTKDRRYLNRISLYPPGLYGRLCFAVMQIREYLRSFRRLMTKAVQHGQPPEATPAQEKQPT